MRNQSHWKPSLLVSIGLRIAVIVCPNIKSIPHGSVIAACLCSATSTTTSTTSSLKISGQICLGTWAIMSVQEGSHAVLANGTFQSILNFKVELFDAEEEEEAEGIQTHLKTRIGGIYLKIRGRKNRFNHFRNMEFQLSRKKFNCPVLKCSPTSIFVRQKNKQP